LLLVDGGDFVHRNGLDNFLESQLTWNEMVRSGYDGVTLGELEFSQWDMVDSLMHCTTLPVVCTNTECLRDGQWQPVGERYRIVQINGVRVGILGVIGPTQLSPSVIHSAGDRIRMLPPVESVQAAAAEIKDRTDVIVLLAHLDPQAMEQYASTLTDVDVILGGHMTLLDTGPILSSKAIINRSSTRGQHVAVTRVIVSPAGRVVDFGGINVTLDPEFPEDPQVAQAAEVAKDEDQRLVRERNQRRQGMPATMPVGDEDKGGGDDLPPR
jgi:2',3'-cyclic-nucleotide 2'-phosphodiesterase (5'-nucleotidase family)